MNEFVIHDSAENVNDWHAMRLERTRLVGKILQLRFARLLAEKAIMLHVPKGSLMSCSHTYTIQCFSHILIAFLLRNVLLQIMKV